VVGDIMGCSWCILCQKRLRFSGRVDECKPLPLSTSTSSKSLILTTACFPLAISILAIRLNNAALLKQRKFKLEAKLESRLSYFNFKR